MSSPASFPSETLPDAVILIRCPRRTTRPVFDQPLLTLSERTVTLIVKNVGGALDAGSMLTGSELLGITSGVGVGLGREGRETGSRETGSDVRGGGPESSFLDVEVVPPGAASNSIDSTSSM